MLCDFEECQRCQWRYPDCRCKEGFLSAKDVRELESRKDDLLVYNLVSQVERDLLTGNLKPFEHIEKSFK